MGSTCTVLPLAKTEPLPKGLDVGDCPGKGYTVATKSMEMKVQSDFLCSPWFEFPILTL